MLRFAGTLLPTAYYLTQMGDVFVLVSDLNKAISFPNRKLAAEGKKMIVESAEPEVKATIEKNLSVEEHMVGGAH